MINVLNFIENYSFISVSARGCVDMGHSGPLCPGAYNAVKTGLILALPPYSNYLLFPL